MSDLKKQLIKLGSSNPDLRTHIRPVLAELKKRGGNTKIDLKYTSYLGIQNIWVRSLAEKLAEKLRKHFDKAARFFNAISELKDSNTALITVEDEEDREHYFRVRVGDQSVALYSDSGKLASLRSPMMEEAATDLSVEIMRDLKNMDLV